MFLITCFVANFAKGLVYLDFSQLTCTTGCIKPMLLKGPGRLKEQKGLSKFAHPAARWDLNLGLLAFPVYHGTSRAF